MLRLYLIRHAHAENKNIIGLGDFDRKLTKKGEKQAKKSGKVLKNLHIKPDLIISSPATRALQTATILAKQVGYHTKDIQQEPGLYTIKSGCNNENFLHILSNCGPQEQTIFRVGHNNQHSYFQEFLTGIAMGSLPKASIVGIEFNKDNRAQVRKGSGKLELYVVP